MLNEYPSLLSIQSMACISTSRVLLLSDASSPGRIKGTSALYCFATSAISWLSVETITLSMYLEDLACSMVYAINGLSKSFLMFFPGNPLEPPRAGITHTILLLLYISVLKQIQNTDAVM